MALPADCRARAAAARRRSHAFAGGHVWSAGMPRLGWPVAYYSGVGEIAPGIRLCAAGAILRLQPPAPGAGAYRPQSGAAGIGAILECRSGFPVERSHARAARLRRRRAFTPMGEP